MGTHRATALLGFVQFAIGIAALVISSTKLLVGPDGGACVLGDKNGPTLCSIYDTMALVTVFSSLIISVVQGCVSAVCCCGWAAPLLVELLGRTALAIAWAVLSIFTTISTVQADHDDPVRSHAYWRHVALGLSWALFVLATGLAVTALCNLCCCGSPTTVGIAGLGLYCCCFNPRYGRYGRQDLCGDCCTRRQIITCAELLCLAWCVRRLLYGSESDSCHGPYGRGHYHPVPSGPAAAVVGPPCSHPSQQVYVHQQHQQQQQPAPAFVPQRQQQQGYAPPEVMQAARGPYGPPASAYPPPAPGFAPAAPPQMQPQQQQVIPGPYPMILPQYAPFAVGGSAALSAPPAMGWGVPVETTVAVVGAGPGNVYGQQGVQPAGAAGPSGATAGPSGSCYYGAASAHGATKEGYEPPSAPSMPHQ